MKGALKEILDLCIVYHTKKAGSTVFFKIQMQDDVCSSLEHTTSVTLIIDIRHLA